MGKYLDSNGLGYFMSKLKNRLMPSGGSAGQVLVKSSGTDYDALWANPAQVTITVDSALDSTSENPVQNKVIKSALDGKQDAVTAGTGLEFSGGTLNHSNAVTAGTIGSGSASSGATVAVPYATYDAQGHITGKGTHTHTINSLAASAIGSGTFDAARIPSLPVSKLSDLSYTERAAYYSTSITNGTSAYTSASTTGWTILDFGDTYVAFGFVSASVSCSTAFGPYYIQSADRYMRLPYATANIIACIFGTAFGGASNSGISCVLRGNNANYLPTSGSLYGVPFRFTSPSSFSTAATQKVPVLLVGRKSG